MADRIIFNIFFFIQKLIDRLGIFKSRRNLFLFILGLTIVLYLFTKWTPHRTKYTDIRYDECLQSIFDQYSTDISNMNAIINHEPLQYGDIVSLPFTGNGYLGVSLSIRSAIQLMPDIDTPFISTSYAPVVQVSSSVWTESSATMVHMNQGLVRRIQCFKINEIHSASVIHTLYAQRRRPSLIIQEIDVVNPSEQTLDLKYERKKQISTDGITQLDQQDLTFESIQGDFLMITNQISLRHHQSIIYVLITNKDLSDSHIQPRGKDKRITYTITKFSPLLSDESLRNKTALKQWQTSLQTEAKNEFTEILAIHSTDLFKEHLTAWSSIWESGFSISRSLAPSAINGDVINRTLYYVLSSTRSPLYDLKIDEKQKTELTQSLFQIDQCYESHSTLLADRLWRTPGDDLAVSQLTNHWRSTLLKKGCRTLIQSGVNGFLQSILLSIGGIRFRDHHLEMNLNPKDLHRDMFFRLIHFGKEDSINISITVALDNRAVIDVTIDNEKGQVYACDAGCLDPPTKLTTKPTRFPVKMTNPSTAVLYISADFDHISRLKDTLHVKEVAIAPPHAHDILALHRHGHKLGGLPLIFWIALAFLIVIFHLFLLKIILNEMGFSKHTTPTIYNRARIL